MRTALLWITAALLPALPAAAAELPAHLAEAVNAAERTDADRERDARDRPGELMEFAGVTPGMRVADIYGAGGYWTELLARAVGPEGRAMLVNNIGYWFPARESHKLRFGDGRLPNVEQYVVENCDMKLAADSVDLAIVVMAYHDLYFVSEQQGWPAIDAGAVLAQWHAALKPGGRLLVVDHAAADGTGKAHAQDLHRIDEAFARADFEAHGFKLEKTWEGLRHPGDDHTLNVFDEAIRGKTDRFVHLYRK